jgi:hypothetical protein
METDKQRALEAVTKAANDAQAVGCTTEEIISACEPTQPGLKALNEGPSDKVLNDPFPKPGKGRMV